VQSVDKLDYAVCLEAISQLGVVKRENLSEELIGTLASFASGMERLDLPVLERIIEALVSNPSKEEVKPSDLSPSVKLTSEFLTSQITPWVEDIRQELFNSRSAPFSTFEEASKWFKEAGKEFRQKFKGDTETKVETKAEGKPERRTLKEQYPFLAYGIRERSSNYPPYLICLFRADEIAHVAGFDTASMLYYILADVSPVSTKVQTYVKEGVHSLPSGVDLIDRLATVEIRGELTFKELQCLYQQIRQELRIKRTKTLNEKHLELYQLVQERGGPVKGKGSVDFWSSVKQDWHNEGCTTWKGAKIAYDRLIKKLTSEYLTKGR